jgi:hypothetical protein
MTKYWENVERVEAKQRRHDRKTAQRRQRRSSLSSRRHFDGNMRYHHQLDRTMYELNLMSRRRSIMMQPTGVCSPVILLPCTNNSRGIIGSFLGGDANVVAFRELPDGSRLVVFCVNDDLCDDEWTDDASAILERMQFKILAGKGIFGNALVVQLLESGDGVVSIGDLVIRDGISRACYCLQVEASEDVS